MKPSINSTTFGSIRIAGETFEHDVVIRLSGKVKKRKKKLSKAVHGTSHVVSREEAEYVHETSARTLVVGAGQYGALKLSDEAVNYLREQDCVVELLPTPEAIRAWNDAEGAAVGLFHVSC